MKKAILLLLTLIISIFISGCSNEENYGTLAKCLSEKGAVMYGTDRCHFCQEQKELFGDSFKLANYVNCDFERGKCNEAGVRGYPTWVINGGKYPGVQSLERLAELSGCQIQGEA